MRIGFVGLGKMGMSMVTRLLSKHQIVAYDLSREQVAKASEKGAMPAHSLAEMAEKLAPPRIVWLMVPAGKPVDKVIEGLSPLLSPGDVLIDGGNSFYKDTIRRAEELKEKRISYLDVGTSGGVEGAEKGLSLTVGGEEEAFHVVEPILRNLAAPGGVCFCGPSGAGHYVKMVHNGVEYALLQAYGEGFEMLCSGPYKLNLAEVARAWNNGSVIRSWLLGKAERALADPGFEQVAGEVGGGETGRWMVEEALQREVPTPVICAALLARYRSRQADSFAGKLVAALRQEFGGHEVKRRPSEVGSKRI
jgi:6-phosphogluconate dehydrogenase